MDVQILLIAIIIALAFSLILLIAYIILVLKEVKATIYKVNLVLDSAKEVTDAMKTPIDYATSLSAGLIQGLKVFNTLKETFSKKDEPK